MRSRQAIMEEKQSYKRHTRKGIKIRPNVKGGRRAQGSREDRGKEKHEKCDQTK